MRLRSLLFVPADSERKLARAGEAGADALILDLEDAVAPERKGVAREMARGFLERNAGWVRVNPLSSGLALADLAAVMPARPAGVMLPKATPAELGVLAHYLDALEEREVAEPGSTRVIVIATETPAATLALADYARAPTPRLAALTWGAEDLSAELGASGNRDGGGELDFPYQVVRVQLLLAAAAAGVGAIDTLMADYRDLERLRASTEAARRQGFVGRLAIHPDQVPVINAAFTPSESEIAQARRVVEAFAGAGTGTVGLDGRMLDRPHLRAAKQVLSMAGFSSDPS